MITYFLSSLSQFLSLFLSPSFLFLSRLRRTKNSKTSVCECVREIMSDYKRSVSTIAGMETSSGASMSKRRKTSGGGGDSGELELLCSSGERLRRDAHLPEGLYEDMTVSVLSPACSVNSAGTVVSSEIFPDRLLSCCSSNVKTSTGVANGITMTTITPPLDLEAKGFETVDSTTYSDLKLFSRGTRYLLSEFSGDSEETTMMLPAKSPPASQSKHGNVPAAKNMPPKEEIEEFFAMAEKYEQKRFAEKYNYDIAKDMPLEGRYQWVRLN